MAKPKHGRWNNHACSSSSSDAHPTPDHPHDRARPRFHPLSRPSLRFPSPAVLSALALIATIPPTVAGGPLPPPPPSFLCPHIERDNGDPSLRTAATLPPRVATSSSSAPPPTPPPSSRHFRRGAVADKYVKGSDSLWRKTGAWTLYGSTCCSSSTVATSGMQAQPSSSQTPTPTYTPTTAQFDTSALPAGWDSATNLNSATESTIILALAIVLAGSICVFIVACVIWRKRKQRTRDIERKLARKLGANDDFQDNAHEKDAQGKMRMWARASARWKSNIRQSARRRRKRPMVSSNRPPSPTSPDSPCVSVAAPSPFSRRGSFVSQAPDSSRSDAVLHPDGGVAEQPAAPHDPPRPSSPPTYGASFASGFSRLPPRAAASSPSPAPSLDGPHAVQRSFIEDEPLPYILPSDGHVATDDKVRLAHIRQLASSPTMADAASPSTAQSVSAPEWHEVEDDLEDLGIDPSGGPLSFQDFGLPLSFPPPPSMADVPFGYLDDHSLHYGQGDDILFAPPAPGPSEPPPGTFPSAPPIDNPGLEPSAPSLDGEDDLFQDWDGTSSYEAPTSADLDAAPFRVMESSMYPTASSTSRASFPSIQESVAGDRILPRYRP